MAVTSTTTITNPGVVSATLAAQIVANTQAAFGRWATQLAGTATIDISVTLQPGLGAALANAAAATGIFVTELNGRNLFLDGTIAEILTGKDPNGTTADILINVDLDDIRADVFHFDPSNGTSPAVPGGKIDYLSVAMHEIGHGLGFNGWAAASYDLTGVTALSSFDRFIGKVNGQGVFTGPNTVALNGGPLVLESGPHINQGSDDLMAPAAGDGIAYTVSAINFAILSDIGMPTRGNDLLLRPAEGGTLTGGAGRDTLAMFAPRDQFTVTGSTVRSPFEQWQTQEIERLAFTDGVLALDLDGNAGQVYRLYQAAFARTPDTAGLAHNLKLVDAGMALKTMSSAFIGSQEFRQRYGETVADGVYINALYRNVLGRDADAGGLAGWQQRLADGSWDRASVLIGFSESAENKALVGVVIANGIWLGSEGAIVG
ncbi:DUF4214 domain-containing protein [Microvirga tunisiensis]|uniref:DUF4214 domain-containing protein n=1 Tax=Pannonibacter tanglangensis TaxID=2750084 RepID=A0A7X5F1S7_9HYPH|nr:DUF4214 domain-containing protein [Pannonibacter sp. XCT-53]NBN78191.1 DUF4214 domain-containing protein [Pannonibacter sp. XCT-53]